MAHLSKKDRMVQITFTLPPSTIARLTAMAQAGKMTRSAVVRSLLQRAMDTDGTLPSFTPEKDT